MATSGTFPKVAGDKIYAADIENLRRIPKATSAGNYTLSVTNVGQHVQVSGSTVTVPTVGSGIQAGDAVTIYNASSADITIVRVTTAPGVYCFIAGTTRQPTKLSVNGLATFLCVDPGSVSGGSAPRFIVSGGGVS